MKTHFMCTRLKLLTYLRFSWECEDQPKSLEVTLEGKCVPLSSADSALRILFGWGGSADYRSIRLMLRLYSLRTADLYNKRSSLGGGEGMCARSCHFFSTNDFTVGRDWIRYVTVVLTSQALRGCMVWASIPPGHNNKLLQISRCMIIYLFIIYLFEFKGVI